MQCIGAHLRGDAWDVSELHFLGPVIIDGPLLWIVKCYKGSLDSGKHFCISAFVRVMLAGALSVCLHMKGKSSNCRDCHQSAPFVAFLSS